MFSQNALPIKTGLAVVLYNVLFPNKDPSNSIPVQVKKEIAQAAIDSTDQLTLLIEHRSSTPTTTPIMPSNAEAAHGTERQLSTRGAFRLPDPYS